MNNLTIIILTFLTFACGQKTETADNIKIADNSILKIDSLQKVSISKATIYDFEKAKNNFIERTLFDTTKFTKIKDKILLPIDNGNVIFKDTLTKEIEAEDVRVYNYIGQFEKIGFYIVSGSFWEHYECYLIDKQTGKKITIWNNPTLSPSDNFIANLSLPYGLEGLPNGIQIWQVNQKNNTKIKKYIELDQQIWAPTEMFWETGKAIILKVANTKQFDNENGVPKDTDFYYLRLKIN